MKYLLDTCVLSEFVKPRPEKRVTDWLNEQSQEDLHISVVTVGELQHGISRLQPSNRRTLLEGWLENDLLPRFEERVLPLDTNTFQVWGKLIARLEQAGTPMALMDALIAATALQQRLTLVTRNTVHFQNTQINLLDPWTL
jgi:toxin FitB